MTLEQIKQAIEDGKNVHWANSAYDVILDNLGQYLIRCNSNQHCIGLTHQDGVTMNGSERQFYVA